MREIKFRGKDINGIWIYGNYVALEDGASPVTSCIWQYGAQRATPVAIETVGQYTGLKDKNGVEIYEGDVLEAEHKLKTQKFKRKYQVIFNEKGYWDAISLDDKPVRLCYAGFDKCEVIGNIYENKELLGG